MREEVRVHEERRSGGRDGIGQGAGRKEVRGKGKKGQGAGRKEGRVKGDKSQGEGGRKKGCLTRGVDSQLHALVVLLGRVICHLHLLSLLYTVHVLVEPIHLLWRTSVSVR